MQSRFLRRRVMALAVLAAAIGLVVYGVSRYRTPRIDDSGHYDERLEQARTSLAQRQFADAERLANEALGMRDAAPEALLVAGEAATRRGRLQAALEYYARVQPDNSDAYVSALFGAGEIHLHQGRLSEGERSFRRALQIDPEHVQSNYRMAFLLGISGRNWEATPYGLELIRRKTFLVSHLLLLGDVERVVKTGGQLEALRRKTPDEPLTALGLARVALSDNRLDEAESLLKEVLSARPAELEAHARLGHVLLLKGRRDRLRDWNRGLPQSAGGHPEVWVVRGLWCRERNDPKGAVRCLREALLLTPNHRGANYQLGQLLIVLNQADQARPFLERADRLLTLSTLLDGLYRHWSEQQIDPVALEKIVGLMESLGRLWEAWGWTQVALKHAGRPDWAVRTAQRIQPRLADGLPQTLASENPARGLDPAAYPLPEWASIAASRQPRGAGDASKPRIQFEDQAAQRGIDFRYFNSADSSTPGARIFETTGGGVGVVDYDGDGWPDLYFTQGAPWPSNGRPHQYSDRLYRNLHDGTFRDETASAGLEEGDFGQGIAAGDFNADGFPDLYVANLGRNRLVQNNGDGTFSDVTQNSGLRRDDWTTSCLMADLNNDGLPDLYDVNYVSGNLSLICKRDGKPMSCSPLAFLSAQDRVWINRGDGRFEDVTDSAGIVAPNGYGLGIVAADLSGSGRLNLFIANDQTSNFYFANESPPGGPLKFRERALAAGLATDGQGQAQGCMGIAVGDADGDGRLDLFVTNFYREPNTLYSAQPGGFFLDTTQTAGLRTPSFLMLGFGTQFLDADLDGNPDLVVANGHIDDLRSLGEPFEMPPQFFHNRGQGRFQELPAKSLGTYFQKKWRGRGLARLDWNRDGREDFVVSHIDAPAALVTNVSQSTGKSLRIRLRGRRGQREAIGATVRVSVGNRLLVQQLTAGDGYQASNQRQLVFGLRDADRADKVEVRWPGGKVQTFRDLPAGKDLLLLEGRAKELPLPTE